MSKPRNLKPLWPYFSTFGRQPTKADLRRIMRESRTATKKSLDRLEEFDERSWEACLMVLGGTVRCGNHILFPLAR